MDIKIISQQQIDNRNYWIQEIYKLGGHFGTDAKKIEEELSREIEDNGIDALLGHLRLCGAIPENYGHDTSEEKLYAKYTDVVIHEAYKMIGFNSLIFTTRADNADVECFNEDYRFVADAKAFRLSRSAKNQKDFKIQSLNNWKHGKPYAMSVCPAYQLPKKKSQIYAQAAEKSVCIVSYTHLAVFARYALVNGQDNAMSLIHKLFRTIETMIPSQDANTYWQMIHGEIFASDEIINTIWQEEKKASIEAIHISRNEALNFLAAEKQRIAALTREQAIEEVLKASKLDSKIEIIQSVIDNGILDFK